MNRVKWKRKNITQAKKTGRGKIVLKVTVPGTQRRRKKLERRTGARSSWVWWALHFIQFAFEKILSRGLSRSDVPFKRITLRK